VELVCSGSRDWSDESSRSEVSITFLVELSFNESRDP
jgi:hypothetical protein